MGAGGGHVGRWEVALDFGKGGRGVVRDELRARKYWIDLPKRRREYREITIKRSRAGRRKKEQE
jgi:hypothetical protein